MAPLNKFEKDNVADQIASVSETKIPQPLHKQPRRNVSFAAEATTRCIIHISEYTSDEKVSTWYSRDELRLIRSEAKLLANSANFSNANVCLRGLEARTLAGATRKKQNRVEARAAVFFEQEIQEEDGFSDPEVIADAYFERTERGQAEAQMMAARDQKEAQEAYQSLKLSEMESPYGKIVVLNAITGSAAA